MSMMMTLTGPSCAGKSYLLQHLLERYPDQFVSMVTHTTRPMRDNEVEGFEYNFVDRLTFEQGLKDRLYCQVVEFGGNLYGTPTRSMLMAFQSGKTPLRIVEPGGVGQFIDATASLGASVFAVYVNSSPELAMARWLARFLMDADEADDDLDQHGEVGKRYAARMVKCFREEFDWINARPYNFYLNCEKQDFASMAHALSRIATGNMSADTAARISPYPFIQDAA